MDHELNERLLSLVRNLTGSFPEVMELPHFEKPSFRVRKKIFATVDLHKNRICLKLSLEDQDVFIRLGKGHVYAVPNKWGKQGWTFLEGLDTSEEMLGDALGCAYCEVAPKSLAAQVLDRNA